MNDIERNFHTKVQKQELNENAFYDDAISKIEQLSEVLERLKLYLPKNTSLSVADEKALYDQIVRVSNNAAVQLVRILQRMGGK